MESKTLVLAAGLAVVASAAFAISPPRCELASGNAADLSATVTRGSASGSVTTSPGSSSGQSQTITLPVALPVPAPLQ